MSLKFDFTKALPWLILVSLQGQHQPLASQAIRGAESPPWQLQDRAILRTGFSILMAHSSHPLQLPSALCRCHHLRDVACCPPTHRVFLPEHTPPRTQECGSPATAPPSGELFNIPHCPYYTHTLLFPAAPSSMWPLNIPMYWRRQRHFPFIIRFSGCNLLTLTQYGLKHF